MRLRPPRDTRDVFRMLRFYESTGGLDAVVERFDFSGVAPDQLQRAVLGAGRQSPPPAADADLAAYCKDLLGSDEFRRPVLRNFLNAFAEKRRLLFVHIPKCAGTDLATALSEQYFTVNGTLDNVHWFPPDALFSYLRELSLSCAFTDTIFVRGHVPLRYYANHHLIRPGDRVFAVVRDPIDVVLSAVNYRLMRLRADPTGRNTDTRLWLRDLGLEQVPAEPSKRETRMLAKAMLREPRVVDDNVICRMLGATTGDAASALANIVRSDIEITDLRRYKAWLRERWGVLASQHANASPKFLTAETLDAADRAVVQAKTAEDRPLYARLVASLDVAAVPWVTGRQLA